MLIKWIVTMGVGLIPGAPGTYGTLLTAGLAAIFVHASGCGLAGPWYAGFVVLFGLAGLWAVHRALESRALGPDPDPGPVVIDEALGILAALSGYQAGEWWRLWAAVALFRLFDITKPWPISRLDRIPGAWGVMLDDLAAGLLAWGIIELALASGVF